MCQGDRGCTVGFAREGKKSRLFTVRWGTRLFGGAPDCSVEHRTVRCAHGQKTTMAFQMELDSRLEGVNRADLKFINLRTTTSRVSVRNMNESDR
jgi:hypothetical protein